MASEPILPGATLGVLGSGQLGRMFALSAREMGYRVHVFSPTPDSPAGQAADREFVASYDDLDAVAEFAASVDAVTLEFENIPTPTAEHAARFVPVRPDASVLHTIQHRAREKGTLRDGGFDVTPFAPVTSLDELRDAASNLGIPGVIKTARGGYDGHGQVVVKSTEELAEGWARLDTDDAIYEAFIEFEREVSVVAARAPNGDVTTFDVFENDHADHVLDVTRVPARISDEVAARARRTAEGIVELLDVVGVLCVEFFVRPDGGLLVNELAPRPHNSGHLTIDACVASQFDLQVRTLCGLPLASTRLTSPAAMANLLGDLWAEGPPDWASLMKEPGLKLHLYGKEEARPGRKMGHFTVLAGDPDQAVEIARGARRSITPKGS